MYYYMEVCDGKVYWLFCVIGPDEMPEPMKSNDKIVKIAESEYNVLRAVHGNVDYLETVLLSIKRLLKDE